jgi:type I phosphodiesterase/nucleotide pyrophosphatase
MSKKLASMSLLVMLLAVPLALAVDGDRDDDRSKHLNDRKGIRHVLLISIDGMHAVDYQNCTKGGYCPNLAALGKTGVSYTNTSTSKPSDSFPGLMALVTGGTPRLTGAYYDVAYDRVLAPPATTTGNGNLAGPCVAGVPNGTTTEYEEGDDIDQTQLNGGAPGANLIDGGVDALDPTKFPRDPFAGCAPVYPWNFIRANTIYGVIHKAGGYTAWSDKHAVYAAVSGPTGTSVPSNVDDYYAPDVNSNIIGLSGLTTADGLVCSVGGNAPDNNGGAWTDSFQNIRCYDQLKANATLNQIDGKTHLGGGKAPVPNIFGMNFQAVSVAQKLIEKIGGVKVFGGYLDAAGTPSPSLKTNITFVDDAIGQMTSELKKQGLLESTLFIVTAKHGQSPIDPTKFQELGSGITTTPATLLANAGFFPPPPIGGQSENPNTPGAIGPTEDDISLMWLGSGADRKAAVALLQANSSAIQAGTIFAGDSLEDMFDKPGIPPFGDPRTPDIIVQPVPGVIYTGSHKKQEEHGGFAHDDTNVMILLSNPNLEPKTVSTFVETRQVAPTILKALGLNPNRLDAVRKEGTEVLPGVEF